MYERNKRKNYCDCDEYKNAHKEDKWDKVHSKKEEQDTIEYCKLSKIIEEAIKNAFKNLCINIEVNPEINIINDTQREVAIGKKGVGAGENTNIGIVGKDGAAAAGTNPSVVNEEDDMAQTTSPKKG